MKKILIYGPFFTNYSLANVNRNLAIELAKLAEFEVKVGCRPDEIDYFPTSIELPKRDDLKDLVELELGSYDIVIFNNFPKTVNNALGLKNLPGKIKIPFLAWEDSIYPQNWVKEINENANAVLVVSSFVKEVLEKSGVTLPVFVLPLGVDPLMVPQSVKGGLGSSKKVKFLHISTAKERKGVDILIKAFTNEFSSLDDVSLIIKSSPGPDNTVESIIGKNRVKKSPEIIHINRADLLPQEIASLISSSSCGVYPSRAEGFGLPALESMSFGKPVIVTAYSGFLDFCNEKNSFLLNYKIEKAVSSSVVNVGAEWAEPSIEELKVQMRNVYRDLTENNSKEVKAKSLFAFQTAQHFTWKNTAQKLKEFISDIDGIEKLRPTNIAVLSSLNDETGISVYTKDIFEKMQSCFNSFYFIAQKNLIDKTSEDSENVVRIWEKESLNLDEIINFLTEKNINILHVEYHTGCTFGLPELDTLIDAVLKINVEVYITFHHIKSGSIDFIKSLENLKKCSRIFIHNQNDFIYASSLLDNVIQLTHYAFEFKKRNLEFYKEQLGLDKFYPIITTHGLLNINKNIDKIIDSFKAIKKIYPNALLLVLTAVSPNNIFAGGLYKELKEKISNFGLDNSVIFIKDFLDAKFIELYLQLSDVLVFFYSEFGESASGAVRRGIAAQKPVIVSNIPTFKEFDNELIKVSDPNEIAPAVSNLLNSPESIEKLQKAQKLFMENNSIFKTIVKTLKTYLK